MRYPKKTKVPWRYARNGSYCKANIEYLLIRLKRTTPVLLFNRRTGVNYRANLPASERYGAVKMNPCAIDFFSIQALKLPLQRYTQRQVGIKVLIICRNTYAS